jgi:hypothetical protein
MGRHRDISLSTLTVKPVFFFFARTPQEWASIFCSMKVLSSKTTTTRKREQTCLKVLMTREVALRTPNLKRSLRRLTSRKLLKPLWVLKLTRLESTTRKCVLM